MEHPLVKKATSLALLRIGIVLLASSPHGVDCSLARRRHPSVAGYSPSLEASELTREESSIPGVSIWTSKNAAASLSSVCSNSGSEAASTSAPAYVSNDNSGERRRGGTAVFDSSSWDAEAAYQGVNGNGYKGADWLAGCQAGRGNIGDADVEPPSRGAREAREELGEDEYAGVLTTEEEDEHHGNGDAAPGRLLEEGGGSDSQEDETGSEDHTEDGDDGEDSDSYDDGSSDSQSEDDEDENSLLTKASRSWGRGGLRVRDGKEFPISQENKEGGSSEGAGSLAKKYEEDEDACFSRLKSLWQEKVLQPLSQAEVDELSEGVRGEQKKLMEAAPTEWNSGLNRISGAPKRGRVPTEGEEEGGGGESRKDEDSSLRLLYRLLLAEMQGNGPFGGLNNRWIDRDALLQLRGAATLAHHPEYLQHTANLPRVTRGVRLVAPEATHSMQEALARSLGHSTGSKVVFLDAKALETVRGKALAEGIPKEQVTSRLLTSALLELASEDGSPFVVVLMDKGSAVLKSRGICQRLTEELKSESSRVLFLLSSTNDPSVPGYSPNGPGDDAAAQDGGPQQSGGGVFGSPLQWPPPQMPPGNQSKRSMQDGGAPAPKKNFIFLQPTPPDGSANGGEYFGGRSPRGGRGGRSGGRGQAGQGLGRGGGPIPPQMLEQMLREAMKNMKAGEGDADNNSTKSNGGSDQSEGSSGNGGSGSGTGGSDIPPGLVEALGEALNDDEFKRTLEQVGKQLGKDMNQGFSIMFSTSTHPLNDGQQGEEGGQDAAEGREDETSHPWGASGSGENPSKESNWQGSSSLSWLTNLRKGIMSGDEPARAEDVEGNNQEKYHDDDGHGHDGDGDDSSEGGKGAHDSRTSPKSSTGGGGGGGARTESDGRSKAETRRGVDLAPSGTEIRAFVNLFEDVAVTPPQDAVLRQHWDAWVKEDVGKHNTHQNRQALMTALRRNMLACPELKRLDPLLARHRLTEAETGQVVLSALKVELSKIAAVNANSMGINDAAILSVIEGEAASPPKSQPVTTAATSTAAAATATAALHKTAKGRLVISRQSMETAFAAVCKAYVPSPGEPMSRTREEVTALAQHDRHEQALVTNVILPKDIGVTYDMIGGLGGAKELLRQCITYPLRFPHLYSEGIAKEAVKGVLLFGPPGTGKTMLAKAVATEGGATFLSVDASVIENKWLGESEKNARAVFTLARRLAPCVIFIDEVDSVLSSREKYDDTTHGTLTSVKTTLMQEWDGLRTGGDRVVVIASTNRPFDLDEAVLRRLPRRILVDLPDAETREEILKVSMAQNRVDASVNFTTITAELEGFTGSDIKEVCREAVVRIAHEKAHELDKAGMAGIREEVDLSAQLRPVTMDDFREARKKLTASVSEKGRELARVWEWNEEYGEVKKKRSDASAQHLSMYL